MEIEVVTTSARRHGIGEDRMRHVVLTCAMPLYRADPLTGSGDLVIFLGPDQHGVPLEVMARDPGHGRLTIFHAMKMRPGYRRQYEAVMRCQRSE